MAKEQEPVTRGTLGLTGLTVNAMALIARHDCIGATLRRAAEFADQAKASLSIFPASPYRDALVAVADYTVSRAS